ncbi:MULTISPECIES: hypothetical protein [Clostridium]|uniref:hypothetical protein n=1 Tax=Clostridium TaxID=1485 RepID=UPI0008253A2C|nr:MULTISPECIES: hypothetical protein [Clostridium]PJI07036.1 hypothetical protein CUB90_03785 [Clostridium sp. CT7]
MGLPSYVINFDELADAIKDYLQNGIKVDIPNMSFSTSNIESLLKDISDKIQGVNYSDLITALNDLGVKIDTLESAAGIIGVQRIYGQTLQIPASTGQYSISFSAPSGGKLTDITYSLSAWNYQDTWDLDVGSTSLFKNVTTKEYGENKHFESFYKVNTGDVIKLTYTNKSGSARTLWADFAILENS